MTLHAKKYKTIDAFKIAFRVTPITVVFQFMLSIFIHAIMPTAMLALATANFVDTATAILQGLRPSDDIYVPLILLLVVLGVSNTVGALWQIVNARLTFNLQRKFRPAIMELCAKLDYRHIENNDSWELITRVSRDPVNAIIQGFSSYMQILVILIRMISILVLIITHVWWAALIISVFSAPVFYLAIRAGKKTYEAKRDAEKYNRRVEYLTEVLIGREAIDERTMFGYGDNINKRWLDQFEAGRILQMKVKVKQTLIFGGSAVSLTLVTVLIALTLINPVISGDMSAGMYMGIIVAVVGMIQQIGWMMGLALEQLSITREYMKDVTAFIELSQTKGVLDTPDYEPVSFKTLQFKNVRFMYPTGDRYVLDGLSFSLENGKHYAVVGKNGAGKTTIAKLLTGLYSGYEGEILIDGKELREYPVAAVKAMFSVVHQDFARYFIPLKDNIVVGDIAEYEKEGYTENLINRIEKSAKLAGLEETIIELKQGLDTALGKIIEDGQDISGGQWQHVAIARSILSRAPIKILDEPTAALDPISESRIYNEFETLAKGKTTVFITHRLGSTKLADEILVINDGKIVERGTHENLMDLCGEYAEMFEAQRGWYL